METSHWTNKTDLVSPGREDRSETKQRVVVVLYDPKSETMTAVQEIFQFELRNHGTILHIDADFQDYAFYGVFLISDRCSTEHLIKGAENSMHAYLEEME